MKYYKLFKKYPELFNHGVLYKLSKADSVYLYNKINSHYPNEFQWMIKYIKSGNSEFAIELLSLQTSLVFGAVFAWTYNFSVETLKTILPFISLNKLTLASQIRLNDNSKHYLNFINYENGEIYFNESEEDGYRIFLDQNPNLIVNEKKGSGKIGIEQLKETINADVIPIYIICPSKFFDKIDESNFDYIIKPNKLNLSLSDSLQRANNISDKQFTSMWKKWLPNEIALIDHITSNDKMYGSYSSTELDKKKQLNQKNIKSLKLKVSKYHNEAYARMGIKYYDLEELELAIEHFKLSLNLYKNDRVYYNLAMAYFDNEEYSKACEALESSIDLKSNKLESYHFLRKIYMKTNNKEKLTETELRISRVNRSSS